MVAFPIVTIDGIASFLSLILAATASLRAGSRLCRRIDMGGSIGLMDGPPILGPHPPHSGIHNGAYRRGRLRSRRSQSRGNLEGDGGMTIGRDDDDDDDDVDDGSIGGGGVDDDRVTTTEKVEASPLWEHAEAFRRAVILGLLFDDDDVVDSTSYFSSSSSSSDVAALYSDVVRHDGGRGRSGVGSIGVVGGGSEKEEEDPAIAAAVEAGLDLLMPGGGARGSGGGGVGGVAVRPNRSMGGGFTRGTRSGGGNSVGAVDDNDGGGGGGNPIALAASWFARELSAPFAALPAWHGLLRSYLRERREDESRRDRRSDLSPWERCLVYLGVGCGGSGRAIYDPSVMDFDESISATASIPWSSASSSDDASTVEDEGGDDDAEPSLADARSVRVRAFAPRAFRDLRNRCFRVQEREYAESILNAASLNILERNGEGSSLFDDGYDDRLALGGDTAVSRIVRDVLAEGRQAGRDGRARASSLPYISFQSNSKGAARAGTFFFFTADGAFMIKTVKNEEARAFLEMLPEYHRFMSNRVNGRNSLLTRIFGMYSVKFPPDDADDDRTAQNLGDRWDGGMFSSSRHDLSSSCLTDDERVYLVMHSVFPPEASSFVTERFDLKGSTVGRECSAEERRSRGANAVLKDLDLKREVEEELRILAELDAAGVGCGHDRKNTSRYGICIGKRSKKALMAQLERDVDLLCRCNVLDYSLLVGVADMDDTEIANGFVEQTTSSGRMPIFIRNVFRWLDFPMPYYGAGTTKVDGGALSSLRGTRRGMNVMYYLGVIDFLQPWTVKKRLERDLKGLAGFDKSEISCVAPADYSARFLKFVNSHVT